MDENLKTTALDQLHAKRKLVVELHQKNMGVMQIVTRSGLSYPAVRACINLFEAGGWPAIQPALRGRRQGKGRILTPAQEISIQLTLKHKQPKQLKLDFLHWSRAAVGQLIAQQLGIQLHERSVGKYLTRWGFSFVKNTPSIKKEQDKKYGNE